MGIAEGVMAGGSILGGVLGSRGSSKAAKAQTNIATAQQRREEAQYQQSRADTMPWLTTGRQALNQLSAMTQPDLITASLSKTLAISSGDNRARMLCLGRWLRVGC